MRWQKWAVIILTLVVAVTPAWAADDATRSLSLSPQGDTGDAAVKVLAERLDGFTLELTVPSLDVTDMTIDGRTYQALALADGGVSGQVGQAALPTITRLVALPAGVGARLRVVDKEMTPLAPMAIAPNLPLRDAFQADTPLHLDLTQYAAAPRSEATVALGEPALMHGLRVVPVTFAPVSYDPSTGAIAVAHKLTVDVTFAGRDTRNDPVIAHHRIPESFARIYEQEIIGYVRDADTMVGPGTYLMICPDNASVTAAAQPLLDWRRRQGYHVLLATTAQTGTSNTAIKSYLQSIYNNVDPPLEFVALVGDASGSVSIPTWQENLSGASGEGDHEYTLLEGGDVLSDVHIGRLSVISAAELTNVVNKVVQYETNPDLSDQSWFTTAGLTGDPGNSGYSTVWVQQFVKESLQSLEYTRIDTIFSGDFTTQMFNTINQGESIFTYRGWWGMSGFSNSYINSLSNGRQLPFAVIMTCGTGSFLSETSQSEAFLRNTGGGGVAAIGTSTIHTHTRYNNCIFLGVCNGVLNTGDYRVGPALTRGKLALYKNFIVNEPSNVTIWSTWNNLMGDPATEIYTGVPVAATVSYPATLSSGANAIPVTVMVGGIPVADAMVTVYQAGNVQTTAYTDQAGQAVLSVAGVADGTLQVTVTKHNLKPFLGSATIGNVSASLDYSALQLSEASGNGDDVPNPGEALDLTIQLANHGSNGLGSVTATLSSPLPYVHVTTGTQAFGTIAGGASAWSQGAYAVSLDADAPGGQTISLRLDASSGAQTWTSLVDVLVTGPRGSLSRVNYSGPGGTMDPGETGNVTSDLVNTGNLASSGATATLSTTSNWVTITDDTGTFGALPIGQQVSQSDPFAVSISSDCYPGHLANFTLTLQFAEGGTSTLEFQKVIGTAVAGDPAGPDAYGYYAFDNTDSDANAPVYDWMDISAIGQNTGLSDNSSYDDDTGTFALPFTFELYGQPQTQVSICTNGWLAFGHTYQRLYRNWYLPSDGGPGNMICGFWDDLANGTVHTYNDTAQHRFIVQWTGWRAETGGGYSGNNTFQIILYDPAYHATETGDGPIEILYNSVSIYGDESTYFTVGIQNEDRTDGLTYAYGNHYAGGAATVAAGRAIRIVPIVPQIQGSLGGAITNASGGGAPIEGALVTVVGAGRQIASDASGHYEGSVPVGTWDVAVYHDSFAPDTTRNVVITEDHLTVADFNLVDIRGPYIANTTMLGNTTDTAGPYVVESNITDVTGVASRHLYYTSSTNGGPFEVPLTVVDPPSGLVHGEIPGQPVGTRVQYWLTAADVVGNDSADPVGAPWPVYSFQVADVTHILDDAMETDTGWQVNVGGGDTATTGIWTRVDPNTVYVSAGGEILVPSDDHTPTPGTLCWVTGQDSEGAVEGGDDVDNGATTLYSPVYDLSAYAGATVSYWRWFSNDTGNAPGEDAWVVQATDDGSSWVTLENTTTSNRSWVQQSFVLEDYIAMTPNVRLRFIAQDTGSGSIVEALVDDLSLDANVLIADQTPPTVALTYPNGGQTFSTSTPVNVTWNAADDIGVVDAEIAFVVGSDIYPVAEGAFAGSYSFVWNEHFAGQPGLNTGRFRVTVRDAAQHQAVDTADGDVTFDISTGVDAEIPLAVGLHQNHPNPFNPRTTITYAVPRAQEISLQIFDVQGKLVRTLVHGLQAPGTHEVTWQGQNDQGGLVASGLYFYRLTSDAGQLTRKMLLLK